MLRGLIYALISASAFGSMAILVKLGYDAGMTGPVMMQFRFTYATIIMGVFLFFKDKRLLTIPRAALIRCAFLGLIVYWLQTTCFVKGLETIPASTASLTLYIHPLVVALLSWRFLKTPMDRVILASLGLTMAGCCLVFYDAFLRSVDPMGMAFAIGAMLFFSGYLLLVQVLLKGVRPLTATLYVMGFAAVSFTLSGDISAWAHQTSQTLYLGLLLGILPGVIAVTFLYMAIECMGSAYACIFSSIEPVITLAAAAVFLGEHVDPLQIGGAILIIAGIVIPNGRNLLLQRSG